MRRILFFSVFLVLISLSGCLDFISWNYDKYPATSAFPSIEVDSKNNVHITWFDNRGRGEYMTSVWRIYYSKFDNDGRILINNEIIEFPREFKIGEVDRLSNRIIKNSKNEFFLVIVIDSWGSGEAGTYYRKLNSSSDWIELVPHQVSGIFVDERNDFHLTWTQATDYDPNPCACYAYPQPYYKKIGLKGNILVSDLMPDNLGYDEKASCNPKTGWITGIRLTNVDAHGSLNPRTVVDSKNKAYVFWLDTRDNIGGKYPFSKKIYYSKLDEFGNVLIDDTRFNNENKSTNEFEVVIDSKDTISVIWTENNGLFYSKPNKNSSSPIKINESSNNPKNIAATTDKQGNIHIVWSDSNCEKGDIYYKQLNDKGETLLNEIRISLLDQFNSSNPKIAADSFGNAHIIWMDQKDHPNDKECNQKYYNKGHYEIYYSKISSNGKTLIDNKRLTPVNDMVYIKFD